MLAEILHPWLEERIAIAAVAEDPHAVDLHDARHLAVEPVARVAVRKEARLLVAAIEFRRAVAGVVALSGVRAIEKLHEVIAVGVVGDPCRAPHHQPALVLQLVQFREAVLVDLHAHADGVEGALPQLVELAVALVRRRGIADDERLSVRESAIAIRAFSVSVAVEQRVGELRIVGRISVRIRIVARYSGRYW